MKKRKIFLIIVFLCLVVSLFIFYLSKKKQEEITIPLPTPNIPSLVKGTYPVEVDFKEGFDFPSKIPLLNLQKGVFPEKTITEIANNLGFGEPFIANDVFDGKTYVYQGETATLTVSVKNQELNYTLNSIPSFANKQLSDSSLVNLATNFLTENGFVSPDDIQFASFSYLKETAGQGLYSVSKEEATFYQVNFSSVVSETTILTLNPQDTPIYVRILPDGTVFKARVIRLGTISESLTQYKLKTYDEVVSEITNATLISLDDGNIHLSDIPEGSIENILISEVRLVYLLDSPTSQILQPVYLFKGKATISGFPSEVNASLYLPAVSSN
jgi:hypothetical protein